MRPDHQASGPIRWMVRHNVAPNLLMLVLVLGGLFMTTQIKQEVFPESEPDIVTVNVALPGATPEEVEQGIILAIEEEVRALEGIDKLTATADEGLGTLTAELDPGYDRQAVLNAIEQAVGRVTTLPQDAEEPEVSLAIRRREVIGVQIYGDVTPLSLREAAESVRDRLLLDPAITQVELSGIRDLELHIEIDQSTLRAFHLTLDQVAETIRRVALDRASGTLETTGGDILLRMADRRDQALDFSSIPIVSLPDGTSIRLDDIATVKRGFEQGRDSASFNGKPAIGIDIYRVGEQTPVSVARAVRAALPEAMASLPESIQAMIVDDRSEIYQARMTLLLKNGFFGLCLVLLLLSLFLEFKLAFWVATGIPTAFMGTLLFLPGIGVSINMISMFAFIVALGIVVDDAIVVGENIYENLQRGMTRLDAAIQGAREIAVPLSFSILTNIVGFLPLALMPGRLGSFFIWIPVVVTTAFLLSWIEAIFILPAHLAAVPRASATERAGPLMRVQRFVSRGLNGLIHRGYAPLLGFAIRWRYATIALMTGGLLIAMAWPISGRMGWGLFPPIPRDYATADITLPVGTARDIVEQVRDRMVSAAERVIDAHGQEKLGKGIYAEITGDKINVRAYLQPLETRPLSTADFVKAWREEAGQPPAIRFVRYDSNFGGPGGGAGIEIQLSHPDIAMLTAASSDLVRALEQYPAIKDTEDGFTPGKIQLEFRLNQTGHALGLSAESVAAQIRGAFFGAQALRQQDGRNELTVRVRLPAHERHSESDIERLLIQTPSGGFVPLYQIVDVIRSRADALITRESGRRVVSVRANVDPSEQTNRILNDTTQSILPKLMADYPGLGYSLEGRQAQQRDTEQSFVWSVSLALVIIYGLLAVPFRSYVQPLIVMTAIPYGFVGAVLGHLIMGMSLSIISIMGVIALAGVVINAALVMIDYANKIKATGVTAQEAVMRAGIRRFRPILLTTLTTFGGLAPMIFETSRQAQFLIPMAVSLGFGIVFATTIVLFLIPCLYLMLEDLRWLANPQLPPHHPDRGQAPPIAAK